MQTKKQILAKYLVKHNALGTLKDAKDKNEFQEEHRANWRECDEELQQRKAELEVEETLTKAQKAELVELKAYLGYT